MRTDEKPLYLWPTVVGPLPMVEWGAPTEVRWLDTNASGHYAAHRSQLAPPGTHTLHLEYYGEVIGFVSFRISQEDLGDDVNLFVGIEHVHIDPRFRRQGWSSFFWPPIVELVEGKLREGVRYTRLFSASPVNSRAGNAVLRTFECELARIARCFAGLSFVGSARGLAFH